MAEFKQYSNSDDNLNCVVIWLEEDGNGDWRGISETRSSGTAGYTQLFNAMLEMGMAELDNSAVIGVIENLAGVTLE